MGFSRQEYWSGFPFPSLGIFPTQGWKLCLPHCRQTLYCLSPQGGHCHILCGSIYITAGASLVAQLVKNLPAMQETLVQFLGQEVLLEKE